MENWVDFFRSRDSYTKPSTDSSQSQQRPSTFTWFSVWYIEHLHQSFPSSSSMDQTSLSKTESSHIFSVLFFLQSSYQNLPFRKGVEIESCDAVAVKIEVNGGNRIKTEWNKITTCITDGHYVVSPWTKHSKLNHRISSERVSWEASCDSESSVVIFQSVSHSSSMTSLLLHSKTTASCTWEIDNK